MIKKIADVSFFCDVSIFAELAILRSNKHKTMTNTLNNLRRKDEKHGKSARKMAFGGHIEYFISNIKVMCTAINKALKVCKFQLHTIGINEPNLKKTLIKCTKWRLTAMLDFIFKN